VPPRMQTVAVETKEQHLESRPLHMSPARPDRRRRSPSTASPTSP
jgi:hypothetical protein